MTDWTSAIAKPPEAEPEEDRADPGSGRDGPAQHPRRRACTIRPPLARLVMKTKRTRFCGAVCENRLTSAARWPCRRRSGTRPARPTPPSASAAARVIANGFPVVRAANRAAATRPAIGATMPWSALRQRLIRRRAHHVARAGGAAMRDARRRTRDRARFPPRSSGVGPRAEARRRCRSRAPSPPSPARIAWRDPRGERAVVEPARARCRARPCPPNVAPMNDDDRSTGSTIMKNSAARLRSRRAQDGTAVNANAAAVPRHVPASPRVDTGEADPRR